MTAPDLAPQILITGATGYVGKRLRLRLEERGIGLRCMARNPATLSESVATTTDVVRGDALEPESLVAPLQGIRVAYYLIHSMGAGSQFRELDRTAASHFGAAAKAAGVERIIYLGGLAHGPDLSSHLSSRHEVGVALAAAGVPVLELRASIIIGSNSLSFEMIRSLVRRLPIMITPRWVEIEAQPIAIADVLEYLLQSLEVPLPAGRIVEIGGANRVSYGEMMREYARQRGLRRVMLRVPLLTPRLSSLWLGLVTPLYARVGRELIESIKHPTIVQDDSAKQLFDVEPVGMVEAMQTAIKEEDATFSESRWFDALSSGGVRKTWAGVKFHNRLLDSRVRWTPVSTEQAFAPIQAIGGARGWYAFNFLWGVRGFLDLLAGGVGTRRGRPLGRDLQVGDALDFWRVEAYEPGARLRLRAEMKLPGRAWLEFEVTPQKGGSQVRQTALFDPVGLAGLAYWYLIFPVHCLVFARMLSNIVAAAERGSTDLAKQADNQPQ